MNGIQYLWLRITTHLLFGDQVLKFEKGGPKEQPGLKGQMS